MGRGWTSVAVGSVALAVLGAGVRAEPSGDGRHACGSNVRLVDSRQRFAVERALRAAIRWLHDPACQALLDEFQDHSGRRLRDCLEAVGLSASDLASRVLFELLHVAGLGENPPTSHSITARVRECCGQGGSTPKADLAHPRLGVCLP